MLVDLSRDVTTIKTLKSSTLKPLHLDTLIQILNYFKKSHEESIVKSGFQATRTTNAIVNAKQEDITSLETYI